MKTITIQINDETAEALDKVANSYDFYKYPIEQAYSLIIEAIVLDVQIISDIFACEKELSKNCTLRSWI